MGNTVKFAVGAALAVGIAIPAGAQDTSGRLIEEIIVTAQKREERLQDVPISISVVSAETLDAFKLNEATDIQNLVPGVSLTNGAGPRSFGFFIRGIGTTSFSSESIEGSSAYVLDGVVMGQAGASLADLPDVERVEVLRGPQGTLFGKNASAGVISLTTVRPTAEWTARGSASWAKPDDERKVSGLLSGPISDSARFLVSARLNQRDGYVNNAFDGRKLNDRDDYGARAKLELTPTQNLSMLFIGDYWKRDAECCIWTMRRTERDAVGHPRAAADRGRHPLQRDQPDAEHRRAGLIGHQELRCFGTARLRVRWRLHADFDLRLASLGHDRRPGFGQQPEQSAQRELRRLPPAPVDAGGARRVADRRQSRLRRRPVLFRFARAVGVDAAVRYRAAAVLPAHGQQRRDDREHGAVRPGELSRHRPAHADCGRRDCCARRRPPTRSAATSCST